MSKILNSVDFGFQNLNDHSTNFDNKKAITLDPCFRKKILFLDKTKDRDKINGILKGNIAAITQLFFPPHLNSETLLMQEILRTLIHDFESVNFIIHNHM